MPTWRNGDLFKVEKAMGFVKITIADFQDLSSGLLQSKIEYRAYLIIV